MFELFAFHQPDGDAEVGDAMQVVGRPIQRVDYPGKFIRRVGFAVFLAKDAVMWISVVQYVDDGCLGFAIYVGDEIVSAFFLDLQAFQPIHRAQHNLASLPRSPQPHVCHRLHL